MGSNLEVVMNKNDREIEFKVIKQTAVIESFFDFLKRTGKSNFIASNGIRVASDEFPEIKESQNIIYLRGKNTRLNDKVDTTPFVKNNPYRDSKYDMYKVALKEFTQAAEKAWDAGLTRNMYTYTFFGGNPYANVNQLRTSAPTHRCPLDTVAAWRCTPVYKKPETVLYF